VPEIAAQFFGREFSSRQAALFARDALAELGRLGLAGSAPRERLAKLEASLAEAAAALAGHGERTDWTALPDAFVAALDRVRDALSQLEVELAALDVDDPGLRSAVRRAGRLSASLEEIADADGEDGLRWAELSRGGYTLAFTPFEVATRLGELMRAQGGAWIFTSATLAVGDDFSHFLGRIGAPTAPAVCIESPFDFETQARIYLPPGLPDPSSREYTASVLEAALPLIEAAGGRCFLLFTSHRALAEGARLLGMRPGFRERFPVLVQGESPRESLLAQFRKLGNAVLLGTASFWEGVDVRGHALALVVIDKLPFAAPEDPLLKARLEGIRRRGGNPFQEFQLPQAALALKQGFGRLIRDREDFGVVMLCDPRIVTRGYGRTFIASLPPAPVVTDQDEAASFLRRQLARAGLAPARVAEA
jgi:ATP-dependent DNA helicase DinG